MGLAETVLGFPGRIRGYKDVAQAKITDKFTEQRRLEALRPLLGKLDPVTAKQVGTAAISADPNAQALGMQQLEGLLGQLDPQAKQTLANLKLEGENKKLAGQSARFGNLLEGVRAKREAVLAPIALDTARQNLDNARQSYRQAADLHPLLMQQARATIGAEAARLQNSNMGADLKRMTFNNTVRAQYQGLPVIQKAVEAQGAYKAANLAVNQGSALGAQVALIKMAKISDPESVVTEGNITTIKNGYGALSALSASLRAAGNKGLSPEQTQMFMDVMDALYGPAMEMAAAATKEYQGFEDQYQARPGEYTNSVGLDWSLTPGLWRKQIPGAGAEVRQWQGGR